MSMWTDTDQLVEVLQRAAAELAACRERAETAGAANWQLGVGLAETRALLADARRALEAVAKSGIEWHETLPNPYTYEASDFSALVVAVHEYEARALAAEALLADARQALAEIEEGRWDENAAPRESPSDWARRCAREALARLDAGEREGA